MRPDRKIWLTPNRDGRLALRCDRPDFDFLRLSIMTSRPCREETALRRDYARLSSSARRQWLRDMLRRLEDDSGRELLSEEVGFLKAWLRGAPGFDAQRTDIFGSELE